MKGDEEVDRRVFRAFVRWGLSRIDFWKKIRTGCVLLGSSDAFENWAAMGYMA